MSFPSIVHSHLTYHYTTTTTTTTTTTALTPQRSHHLSPTHSRELDLRTRQPERTWCMWRKGGVPSFRCCISSSTCIMISSVLAFRTDRVSKSPDSGMGVSVSFENGGASKSRYQRRGFRVLFSSLTASQLTNMHHPIIGHHRNHDQ